MLLIYNRVRLIFFKCRRDNLSFCNLKTCSLTNFPSAEHYIYIYIIYIYIYIYIYTPFYHYSSLTSICFFEFSNVNSRIKCKICSKLTIEVPDYVLVSLLLTFDIFVMLFQCVFAEFEHVNDRWIQNLEILIISRSRSPVDPQYHSPLFFHVIKCNLAKT